MKFMHVYLSFRRALIGCDSRLFFGVGNRRGEGADLGDRFGHTIREFRMKGGPDLGVARDDVLRDWDSHRLTCESHGIYNKKIGGFFIGNDRPPDEQPKKKKKSKRDSKSMDAVVHECEGNQLPAGNVSYGRHATDRQRSKKCGNGTDMELGDGWKLHKCEAPYVQKKGKTFESCGYKQYRYTIKEGPACLEGIWFENIWVGQVVPYQPMPKETTSKKGSHEADMLSRARQLEKKVALFRSNVLTNASSEDGQVLASVRKCISSCQQGLQEAKDALGEDSSESKRSVCGESAAAAEVPAAAEEREGGACDGGEADDSRSQSATMARATEAHVRKRKRGVASAGNGCAGQRGDGGEDKRKRSR
jgi:hypothetical protein